MDKTSEPSKSTIGASKSSQSSLSLNEHTSENSFFVFGNVYVSNGTKKPIEEVQEEVAKSNPSEIQKFESQIRQMNAKMEMLEIAAGKNSSVIENIQKILEKKDKRKQRREKAQNYRESVYHFGTDIKDVGFSFQGPKKVEIIKQQQAKNAEAENQTAVVPVNRRKEMFMFH